MLRWFWKLMGWDNPNVNAPIPVLVCMHQDDTWCWPAHLGEKTAGKCSNCGEPIWYEVQNGWVERKVCNRCV